MRASYQTTRGWSLSAKIGWYTGPRLQSGCREWLGSVDQWGYALLNAHGRPQHASRVVVGLTVGDPRMALHSCDNPKCVEPSHLRIGTHIENMADKAARGRARGPTGDANPNRKNPERLRGPNNPNAKLSAEDIERIVRDYEPYRMSRAKLAKRFGVAKCTIDRVLHDRRSADEAIRVCEAPQ